MAAPKISNPWKGIPDADFQTDNVRLFLGDCLEIMPRLPAGVFDTVVTDPPYGCTANTWDRPLPVAVWWYFLDRLRKANAIISVCAQQPFTTELLTTCRKEWRYELIWDKSNPTGFLDAHRRPMRAHEHIHVFAKTLSGAVYHPQMTQGRPYISRSRGTTSTNWGQVRDPKHVTVSNGQRFPRSVLYFSNSQKTGQHPTQKPLDMMAWLVKTYSNRLQIVGDIFMGSGTTGVACVQAGRRFIGIERDPKYFDIAVSRIKEATIHRKRE